MTALFRVVAIAIAVAGAIDPAFAVRRSAPLAIDVYTGRGRAADIRARLARALGPEVRICGGDPPQAVVFVGRPVDPELVRDGVPVSTIALPDTSNVRIAAVPDPQAMLPGRSAEIAAEIEAVGVAGQTTAVVLEQHGVEVGRAEHMWAGDGRARIGIPFVALDPGVHVVRLAAQPLNGEADVEDNAVDVRVAVHARPLRVLIYGPRLSWAAGFVRSALEADPAFEIASMLRPSRSIDARAGDAPRALSLEGLFRFDAVVIGAPEELRPSEVEALDLFAARRGGAIVLIPDRRPSGAYLSLLPVRSFDEVLLEAPVALEPGRPAGLRASEFAVPPQRMRGATVIGELTYGTSARPAIVSWPRGEGRIIYSGALDAWRYRGDEGAAFSHFWRSVIAAAALAAPPRVEVSLDPGVAAPGAHVRLRARLRRTEYDSAPARSSFPEVRAEWIGGTGTREAVRMWPAAEIGVYEGLFDAPEEGTYDVRVSTSGGASSDTTLVVKADAAPRRQHADTPAIRPLVSQSTGGVAATSTDLSPLVAHVRALPRDQIRTIIHPMRSAWWIVPFAGALCAEWGIRRKRGLR